MDNFEKKLDFDGDTFEELKQDMNDDGELFIGNKDSGVVIS